MADGTMDVQAKPTEDISVRETFGIDTDMVIKGFAEASDRVPEILLIPIGMAVGAHPA